MSAPVAALQSYLCNAFTLKARASRSEYWWPALFVVLAVGGAAVADALKLLKSMNDTGALPPGLPAVWSPMVCLLMVVPTLTVTVRRLHDSGRSGAWLLVQLVPVVGPLLLLYFLLLPSEPRANRWGAPHGATPDRAGPEVAQARRRRGHVPSALDSYAVLLQAEAQPSPEELARRRQEVHEYFQRNVSRRASA